MERAPPAEPTEPQPQSVLQPVMGARLRARRRALRKPLRAAARDLGVPPEQLAALEAGEPGLLSHAAALRLFRLYADYLGFDVRRLPGPAPRLGRLLAFSLGVLTLVIVALFAFAIQPQTPRASVAVAPEEPGPTQTPAQLEPVVQVVPMATATFLPPSPTTGPPTATLPPSPTPLPSPTNSTAVTLTSVSTSTPLPTDSPSTPPVLISATVTESPLVPTVVVSATADRQTPTVTQPPTVTPSPIATATPIAPTSTRSATTRPVATPTLKNGGELTTTVQITVSSATTTILALLPTPTPTSALSPTVTATATELPTVTPTIAPATATATVTPSPAPTATSAPANPQQQTGRVEPFGQNYLRVVPEDGQREMRITASVGPESAAYRAALKVYLFNDLQFRDLRSTEDLERNSGAGEIRDGLLTVPVQPPVPNPLHVVVVNFTDADVEYTLTISQGVIADGP